MAERVKEWVRVIKETKDKRVPIDIEWMFKALGWDIGGRGTSRRR